MTERIKFAFLHKKSIKIVTVSLIILVPALIYGLNYWRSGDNPTTSKTAVKRGGFSVRWMGFFTPDYNCSYPEYYICINNLKDDPFQIQIALQIKNQEDSGYYFKVDQYESPPPGWSILPMEVEYIDVGQTKQFIYMNASRSKPASIPQGRLTESINLVVQAYYDDSYTNLYSQDNFTITFNFIDRMSSAWSILYHDNFNDVTVQNWTSMHEGGEEHSECDYGASVSPSYEYYRSFQYSLKLHAWATGYSYEYWPGQWLWYAAWVYGAYEKTFEIPYTSEVYLVFSIRGDDWQAFSKYGVMINGSTYFKSDLAPNTDTWYQYTIPLQRPLLEGQTCVNVVDIWVGYAYHWASGTTHSYAYLDDVYVIAK